MSISTPSFPEIDRSSQWILRVVVGVCLATITALTVPLALHLLNPAVPERPAYDYNFTGDSTGLHALAVPEGFREMSDRPGCTESADYVRCFVTTMDRPSALAFLHSTVGTAAHDNDDGNVMPGWTACGTLLGSPAIGFIRRDPANAVRTAPGSWNAPPSGPTYQDRLSVGIMLVNAPHCA